MSMRSSIGDLLKSAFVPDDQVMPRTFLDLLDQLAALEDPKPRPGALSDEAFKDQIAAVIPQLRAFGRVRLRPEQILEALKVLPRDEPPHGRLTFCCGD